FAHQRQHLAACDAERNVMRGGHRAVAARKSNREILERDQSGFILSLLRRKKDEVKSKLPAFCSTTLSPLTSYFVLRHSYSRLHSLPANSISFASYARLL